MSSEDVNLSGGRDRGLGRVGGKKKELCARKLCRPKKKTKQNKTNQY